MQENIESVYERVKGNKIGWREEIAIGARLYLVFARPDESVEGQSEIVFRELIKEKPLK